MTQFRYVEDSALAPMFTEYLVDDLQLFRQTAHNLDIDIKSFRLTIKEDQKCLHPTRIVALLRQKYPSIAQTKSKT